MSKYFPYFLIINFFSSFFYFLNLSRSEIRTFNASKEARVDRMEKRNAENVFIAVDEGPTYAAGMAG